jgi:predicted dienelactone hydrolase
MPSIRRTAAALVATSIALSVFAQAPASSSAPPAAAEPPAATGTPAKLYKEEAGPFTFKTIDEDWADQARTPNRTIPVRMFVPEVKAEPGAAADAKPSKLPVIIFSPGLGASRITYAYFARHLASNGYIVIVPSHPGSDTAAAVEWIRQHGEAPARGGSPATRLRARNNADGNDPNTDDRPGGWLLTSINDPDNLRERPRDISFIISKIPTHAVLGPIANMSQIGVGGHSFGAYTAMAIGGMRVDLPESHGGAKQSFRDPRVRAVLPMSPEGAGAMGIVPGAWDSFRVPALFLTGTRDYGAGGRSASWRRQAFEGVHGFFDYYLITLDGAGHMTFGRPEGVVASKSDASHAALIRSLGTAFFDAYVRDNDAAKDWIRKFAVSKPAGCTAEYKPAEAVK